LGLAIVRAFTEANDGRVWYEETPGGGATFVLDLRAARDDLQ
jgi:signal transduction histidine kinase